MKLSNISDFLVGVAVVLYLVFPSLFSLPKLIFLLSIVAYVHLLGRKKSSVTLPLFDSFLLYFALLFPLFFISILSQNPGAIPIALTNYILPAIFYFLFSLLSGLISINLLIILIGISSPIILLMQLVGYIDPTLYLLLQARSGDVSSGVLASTFTYSGIKSLYFILPFLSSYLSALMIYSHNNFSKNSVYVLFFCVISADISLFLSFEGTSFGIIVISFIPFILYLINWLAKLLKSFRLALFQIYAFSVLFVLSSFTIYFAFDNIYTLLFDRLLATSSIDPGDYTRSLLFQEHLKSVLQSPFFGLGIGVDNGLGRSGSAPWASELTYMNALSQYGLIGIFILINYIGLFFIQSLKFVVTHFGQYSSFQQAPFLLAYVYGIFSALVAAINNPSLGSSENLFIFLIPVLVYGKLFNLKSSSLYTLQHFHDF